MDFVTLYRHTRGGDKKPADSRKSRTIPCDVSLLPLLEDATMQDFQYLLMAAAMCREYRSIQIACRTHIEEPGKQLQLWYRHLEPLIGQGGCIGLPITAHWPNRIVLSIYLFHHEEIPLEIRKKEYLNVEGVGGLLAKLGYEQEE